MTSKRFLTLFMAMAIIFSQLTITSFATESGNFSVNTPDSSECDYECAFNPYFMDSYNESIYNKEDLKFSGTINSLAYFVRSYDPEFTKLGKIKIWLGTTSKTQHDSDTDWIDPSNLTLVYSNDDMDSPQKTGWFNLQLDTPYNYDGTENLVIVVSKSNDDYDDFSDELCFDYYECDDGSLYKEKDNLPSTAEYDADYEGDRLDEVPTVKFSLGDDYSISGKVVNVNFNQSQVNSDYDFHFIQDENSNFVIDRNLLSDYSDYLMKGLDTDPNSKNPQYHFGDEIPVTDDLNLYVIYNDTTYVKQSSGVVSVTSLQGLLDAIEVDNVEEIIVKNPIALTADSVIDGKGKIIRVETPGTDETGLINNDASDYQIFVNDANNTELSNMIIKGGSETPVENSENCNLKMTNVTITQSGSDYAYGGAFLNSGTAFLNNCSLSRNVANYGGGFLNIGTMTIKNSSVCENRNIGGGSKGGGGAQNSGTLFMDNCTVANNQSTEIGGGLNLYKGAFYMSNSTVTGNVTYGKSTANFGGGIGVNNSKCVIINSILADNYASVKVNGETTIKPSDLGVYDNSEGGPYQIVNSIIGDYEDGGYTSSYENTNSSINDSSADIDSLFADYRQIGLVQNDGSQNNDIMLTRPAIVKAENSTYIVPLKANNSNATTSGTYAYSNFDIDDLTFGYEKDGTIQNLLGTCSDEDKITTYQEGSERSGSVVGAAPATDKSIYTVNVKLGDTVNGKVYGVSVFGDSYLSNTNISVKAVADDGYVYKEWQKDTGTGYTKIDTEAAKNKNYTFAVTESMTLNAIFEEGVELSYDDNAANINIKVPIQQASTQGDSITVSTSVPTRPNYVFDSWNTEWDGTGSTYNPGDSITLGAQSIVLYAQWKKIINVTYTGDYNGTEQKIEGESAELPTCNDSGYEYIFSVESQAFSGENLQDDVTVTVTKAKIPTLTYEDSTATVAANDGEIQEVYFIYTGDENYTFEDWNSFVSYGKQFSENPEVGYFTFNDNNDGAQQTVTLKGNYLYVIKYLDLNGEEKYVAYNKTYTDSDFENNDETTSNTVSEDTDETTQDDTSDSDSVDNPKTGNSKKAIAFDLLLLISVYTSLGAFVNFKIKSIKK